MIGILANESNGQLNNQQDSEFPFFVKSKCSFFSWNWSEKFFSREIDHLAKYIVTLKVGKEISNTQKCVSINPYGKNNPCSKKPKLNHNMFEFDLLRFKSSGKK